MEFAKFKEEKVYFIDLFCGAGGTSSGIHRVKIPGKVVKVIACINHDPNAILSHKANHPETVHYTEDIKTIDLHPIIKQVQEIRAKDMFAKIAIWASLECTNFSKAKGGKPKNADSRTLAEHLFRYLDVFNPDFLYIENVSEFMDWGDLDKDGKPIPKYKGRLYKRWVKNVNSYGFHYDYKLLNSADYGIPQKRTRLFIQFAKKKSQIKWCPPTHSKDGSNGLKKHLPVRHCLNLKIVGKSIFEGKPRSEKTLERLYYGLIKFVGGGENAFMVKYNSFNSKTGKYIPPSMNMPSPTICTQERLAVCHFTSLYYSGRPNEKNKSLDEPSATITTIDHHALVKTEFVSHYHSGNPDSRNKSIDEAANTVLTTNHHSLVQPQFIQKYYSNGQNIDSIDDPSATITTKDRLALVSGKFVYRDFTNGSVQSLDCPSGAVLTVPKLNLVSPEYILNPQWGVNCSSSLEKPSATIIARQDKTPMYLVSVEYGYALPIYEDDSPWTIKLKEAMIVLGVVDLKMRMFLIEELLKIQDFSENYVLIGTQSEQKKFIGNAVPCGVVHKLIEYIFK